MAMKITNERLYTLRCSKCAFCVGTQCTKENWHIPSHDSCLAYRYNSNLTKYGGSQGNKRISANSAWFDLRKYAEDSSTFAEGVIMAARKKAYEFYGELPSVLYFCNICGIYCNSSVCSECSSRCEEADMSIDSLTNSILSFVALCEPSDAVKIIQYMDIDSILLSND